MLTIKWILMCMDMFITFAGGILISVDN